MVTGSLKNYTDENIIELIESLKTKSVAYNLNDLKAVLAEVNNRHLEGNYAEVLGELIRDKILNGDIDSGMPTPPKEETVVAPAISPEEIDEKEAKKAAKEDKKKEKMEEKEKKKVKSVQQKAKEEEIVEEESEKYPVLHFLTGFLKFAGWLSLAVSVIYGLYTSVTKHLSNPGAAIGSIFAGLLTGTVILLLCYYKSESIAVKLDIEGHLEKIAGDK